MRALVGVGTPRGWRRAEGGLFALLHTRYFALTAIRIFRDRFRRSEYENRLSEALMPGAMPTLTNWNTDRIQKGFFNGRLAFRELVP
jgi:hypothetical protein